jgi:hypothetical protein
VEKRKTAELTRYRLLSQIIHFPVDVIEISFSANVEIFVHMSAYKIGYCRLVLLLNLKIFNEAVSTANESFLNHEWIRNLHSRGLFQGGNPVSSSKSQETRR